MPPGETDKHMFALEEKCKILEAFDKARISVKDSVVVLGKHFSLPRGGKFNLSKKV